jgi:hypothetical protein
VKQVIYNSAEFLAFASGLAQSDDWPITLTYTHGFKRSISQNALSHSMYSEISRYLILKGRTDCSPAWIKKALKSKFLGWMSEVYVDIVTGEKTEREVLRHTSDLDSGEMCHYLTQCLAWACDIGCDIRIPANSVYMKLMEQQNQ